MDDAADLIGLGREMLQLLDESGWASRWLRGAGDRELEVAVEETESHPTRALLDLPWEVLANREGFLANDHVQRFVVFRSIGRSEGQKPMAPRHRDLAVMFMAAAPRGQQELDFEAEEAGILEATARLPVQLVVEESGCPDFLKDRLSQEGPFEAVHVSCHGTIEEGVGPVLALETPEGDLALTDPGDFAAVLGHEKPPLAFLSACRTAEDSDPRLVSEPFVRAMVRAGVPNVLGWDGSVYDADGILFARVFYAELAGHEPVPFAAAVARGELLAANREDPNIGRHWHLARVYAGPDGAGPCCDRARPQRRLRRDAGFKEFLDKANHRVPVATAQKFVGRRRQVQRILRVFREGENAGVLLFGMGNLGKSSLAARVANRMPGHETVVVYERYDSVAVLDRLLAALPPGERSEWDGTWREQVAGKGALLGNALEEMLEGPFHDIPILLIIDDLERILEEPRPGQMQTPIKEAPGRPAAWRESISAVLRAFKAANTTSRLLLTSRFDFTLPDGQGGDLADILERVQLLPMETREREKQWQAAERLAPEMEWSGSQRSLVSRALRIAGGNPGLQEILCRPILSGDLDAARTALDAVEGWQRSGEIPTEENAAQEFFRRVAFETYRKALTEVEAAHLRAATLFSEGLPIPISAIEAAGTALGAAEPWACLRRLIGLGLVDFWGELQGFDHAAANPLARPLIGAPLTEAERERLAAAAVVPLAEAWCDSDGDFPFDPRGVEAARLAMLGDAPTEIVDAAALAAGTFLFHARHDAKAALPLLEAARVKIEANGGSPSLQFLSLAADCAERLGERDLQIALLEKGLAYPADDEVGHALIAVRHATATIDRDGPEKALERLIAAAGQLERAGEVRSRAVTMGQIADILQGRGDTEEALRIRREEQLPVFERLGDMRSRAVTMGKIADILQGRGDTEEALRIRHEEQLPVFERLGDVRERAVTMGRIADILQGRGDTEEALRIRREEQLPVYERLGDVRSRAVTMGKIADILQGRGDTEEALRIHREKQLPVFERLGDVRSRAVTMGKIAGILQGRGDTEEALRIRREEQLPVYERLGDVHSRAVTMGKIADILQGRGDTEEALRIHREEQLPVYERLGDVHERALTMGRIADILQGRGDTEEALRIRREEELPVYERLGDVRSRAVTMGQIADILQGRGDTEEALRIHREEQLPVYERLGDVRERALTMGKIADILEGRGDTEEALRIRHEEELPIYERLGDVRSRAMTMGKIAGILQGRGDTEEALRILTEECLPVAERIGDAGQIAHICFSCASIRLRRGGLEKGEAATIIQELADSYTLNRKVQRMDGVAVVGGLLGRLLLYTKAPEAAVVLDQAAAAYERLGNAAEAGKLRALIPNEGP